MRICSLIKRAGDNIRKLQPRTLLSWKVEHKIGVQHTPNRLPFLQKELVALLLKT